LVLILVGFTTAALPPQTAHAMTVGRADSFKCLLGGALTLLAVV
jgi:hypothetical protein